jgi:hypothetical protein
MYFEKTKERNDLRTKGQNIVLPFFSFSVLQLTEEVTSMLEEIMSAGLARPTPKPEPIRSTQGEPDCPPAVPEANKDIWNYMGSELLMDAVEGKIVSQMEAEVVMEVASYERSYHYVSRAVGISPERVIELYQDGIRKLRHWLSR